jgi:AcrR family transcriptional regulator
MSKSSSETTYHHGDLHQSLINAALELITENQETKTLSLREVARRVGVSHAAPYRHFADKDALLAAVAEEGFHVLTLCLQSSLENTSYDPLQGLQAIGVAYVEFAIAHPAHYRVMFGAFRADSQSYPSLSASGQEAFTVMINTIEIAQDAGKINRGESQHLAWVAWSLVHGLAMLLLEGQLPIADERDVISLAKLATESLICGIKHRGKTRCF